VDKSIYSDEHRILSELLREARVKAGLRQADVAERVGWPQSAVSKYESGERRLDLVELRQVCAALGISLAQLIGRFEKARVANRN
jgi:transcriptional regulator with XRE-family HTH domain